MSQCIRHLLWRGAIAVALVAVGIGSGLGLAGDPAVAGGDARCDAPATLNAVAEPDTSASRVPATRA
jgi:hypothetical protein